LSISVDVYGFSVEPRVNNMVADYTMVTWLAWQYL